MLVGRLYHIVAYVILHNFDYLSTVEQWHYIVVSKALVSS